MVRYRSHDPAGLQSDTYGESGTANSIARTEPSKERTLTTDNVWSCVAYC